MADEQVLAKMQVALMYKIVAFVVGAVCRLIGIVYVCNEFDRPNRVLLVFGCLRATITLMQFHTHHHIHFCRVPCSVGSELYILFRELIVTVISQIGGNPVSFVVQCRYFKRNPSLQQ